MTITTGADFAPLLSSRAAIGRAMLTQISVPGLHQPIAYAFAGGQPDPGSFPYDELAAATARMLREDGAAALTYGDPQGYPGLRELVAHKYARYEGLQAGSENILIANGSGHALSLALSAFVDVGDAIICEAPTFLGTLATMRRHGADIHGVPIDDDGISIDQVRARLETLRGQGRRCKLIYTMPNFHNPAGPTMSLERRRALVALAQEYGTLILEDDAYGELRYEGEALPSLYALDDRGVVIRSGTLSKILGAGMRLGWLLAPAAMIPVFQSFNFGGGVAPFTSRVATWYLRDHLEEHVATLVEIYRARRDAMLDGLHEVLAGTAVAVSRPAGGFFIWITLPDGADVATIGQRAGESGVAFVPGTAFYHDGGGQNCLRLAFSYETAERCFAGATTLARVIRESLR